MATSPRFVFRLWMIPAATLGLLAVVLLWNYWHRDTDPVRAQSVTDLPSTVRPAPQFSGAVSWLNSPPLSAKELQGKVIVVDFWTYSCINCLRSLPYSEAWYERYKDSGLVVIGVHTPEFEFETDPARIQRALSRYGLHFPVAVDSRRAIWDAFDNHYWPAHYFIDAKGFVRYHHFGEGEYDRSEQWIRELLQERDKKAVLPPPVSRVLMQSVQQAADWADVNSPETYIGSERAAHFASPGGQRNRRSFFYTAPEQLSRNQWALTGAWTVQGESAHLDSTPSSILFRFHARDLHLVLGPGKAGKPIRFRVRIDGAAPGNSHGSDCNAAGEGVVDEERLYQLIRQSGTITDHTFEIEFLDPGVEAFAFTFG